MEFKRPQGPFSKDGTSPAYVPNNERTSDGPATPMPNKVPPNAKMMMYNSVLVGRLVSLRADDVEGSKLPLRFPSKASQLGYSIMCGRDASCHIQISDPSVSRYHASFEYRDNQLVLTRLTQEAVLNINGEPLVGSVVLKDKDVITIGFKRMRFDTVESTDEDGEEQGRLSTNQTTLGISNLFKSLDNSKLDLSEAKDGTHNRIIDQSQLGLATLFELNENVKESDDQTDQVEQEKEQPVAERRRSRRSRRTTGQKDEGTNQLTDQTALGISSLFKSMENSKLDLNETKDDPNVIQNRTIDQSRLGLTTLFELNENEEESAGQTDKSGQKKRKKSTAEQRQKKLATAEQQVEERPKTHRLKAEAMENSNVTQNRTIDQSQLGLVTLFENEENSEDVAEQSNQIEEKTTVEPEKEEEQPVAVERRKSRRSRKLTGGQNDEEANQFTDQTALGISGLFKSMDDSKLDLNEANDQPDLTQNRTIDQSRLGLTTLFELNEDEESASQAGQVIEPEKEEEQPIAEHRRSRRSRRLTGQKDEGTNQLTDQTVLGISGLFKSMDDSKLDLNEAKNDPNVTQNRTMDQSRLGLTTLFESNENEEESDDQTDQVEQEKEQPVAERRRSRRSRRITGQKDEETNQLTDQTALGISGLFKSMDDSKLDLNEAKNDPNVTLNRTIDQSQLGLVGLFELNENEEKSKNQGDQIMQDKTTVEPEKEQPIAERRKSRRSRRLTGQNDETNQFTDQTALGISGLFKSMDDSKLDLNETKDGPDATHNRIIEQSQLGLATLFELNENVKESDDQSDQIMQEKATVELKRKKSTAFEQHEQPVEVKLPKTRHRKGKDDSIITHNRTIDQSQFGLAGLFELNENEEKSEDQGGQIIQDEATVEPEKEKEQPIAERRTSRRSRRITGQNDEETNQLTDQTALGISGLFKSMDDSKLDLNEAKNDLNVTQNQTIDQSQLGLATLFENEEESTCQTGKSGQKKRKKSTAEQQVEERPRTHRLKAEAMEDPNTTQNRTIDQSQLGLVTLFELGENEEESAEQAGQVNLDKAAVEPEKEKEQPVAVERRRSHRTQTGGQNDEETNQLFTNQTTLGISNLFESMESSKVDLSEAKDGPDGTHNRTIDQSELGLAALFELDENEEESAGQADKSGQKQRKKSTAEQKKPATRPKTRRQKVTFEQEEEKPQTKAEPRRTRKATKVEENQDTPAPRTRRQAIKVAEKQETAVVSTAAPRTRRKAQPEEEKQAVVDHEEQEKDQPVAVERPKTRRQKDTVEQEEEKSLPEAESRRTRKKMKVEEKQDIAAPRTRRKARPDKEQSDAVEQEEKEQPVAVEPPKTRRRKATVEQEEEKPQAKAAPRRTRKATKVEENQDTAAPPTRKRMKVEEKQDTAAPRTRRKARPEKEESDAVEKAAKEKEPIVFERPKTRRQMASLGSLINKK